MLSNDWLFAAEFRSDGRLLTQRRFDPWFEPAFEWTGFAALRQGGAASGGAALDAVIHPVPHAATGLPYISGFRVTLRSGVSASFPARYFRPQLQAIRNALVKDGVLSEGMAPRIALLAYPAPPPVAQGRPAFKVVEETPPALNVRAVSFADLAAGATPFGEQTPGDFPVYIPQQILEETAELTLAAGAVETGGILIGHLCHDEAMRETGIVVTAQIPAPAVGESKKLTFDPDAWAAVQAALTLRRSDEAWLGWWHSHPSKSWCASCPIERRRECALMGSFFSEDDVCLHQSVFSKSYMVALVVTNADAGLTHDLYGYRDGIVSGRGFSLQPSSKPLLARASVNKPANPEIYEKVCS